MIARRTIDCVCPDQQEVRYGIFRLRSVSGDAEEQICAGQSRCKLKFLSGARARHTPCGRLLQVQQHEQVGCCFKIHLNLGTAKIRLHNFAFFFKLIMAKLTNVGWRERTCPVSETWLLWAYRRCQIPKLVPSLILPSLQEHAGQEVGRVYEGAQEVREREQEGARSGDF